VTKCTLLAVAALPAVYADGIWAMAAQVVEDKAL
jgi:hypothetical protein